MLRNLTYRIPIREGADSIGLTRYLELEEGCDVNEEFLIETPRHSIGFIPAELVELRAAIDEMLRMAEQHVEALTDGASPSTATLTVGEANLISADDVKLLRMLSNGVTLEMGHRRLNHFRNRGWVDVTPETGSRPTSLREYGITDKGRRALATQTPEAESEPAPDEALVLNRAEKEILRALAHGDALWLKNDRAGLYGAVASVKEASIKSLWDARLIGPGDEPANMVDGMEDGLLWYTISVKGRRALAAQTPEAEQEV